MRSFEGAQTPVRNVSEPETAQRSNSRLIDRQAQRKIWNTALK